MSNAMKPLRIWCSRRFPSDIRARLDRAALPHCIIDAADAADSNLLANSRDRRLINEFDVAFGQPEIEDCMESRSLRWIQLSTAGYTRYDRDDLKASLKQRGVALCNASGVYDEPCAQHVVAMMLALARQLPAALLSQQNDRAWPYLPLRAASRLLSPEQLVLLVGFGAIARRVVQLLRPFGVQIVGFRRTPRGDEGIPVHTIDRLNEHLPRADHVLNILPAAPTTRHLFNADRLGRLKPGSIFYNIGRGDTVDQDALLHALQNGPLGYAYLDVTTPEPLPAAHPLWAAPNCFITPHTAGGSDDEADRQVDHFIANLRRFERGEALADRIV